MTVRFVERQCKSKKDNEIVPHENAQASSQARKPSE